MSGSKLRVTWCKIQFKNNNKMKRLDFDKHLLYKKLYQTKCSKDGTFFEKPLIQVISSPKNLNG
jgi:hypothetical protein